MGTASEWDITVPDDDGEFLAELRRHGVTPGRRLHVAVLAQDLGVSEAQEDLPAFFGSFAGAPDLAKRSSEILQAEFPGL